MGTAGAGAREPDSTPIAGLRDRAWQTLAPVFLGWPSAACWSRLSLL
ncbi:hypothetical protein I545_1291 [Mycobacterium kansasii 662]|uniref:Uncharacterized protein n=2 Tax=Mycobacterium kansasii TaxID=1768 RepID=A0A1V3XTX8_MYCKA|nr:hypothetical protein I547_5323 [Mycobacterium kansasii 824]EUA21745.1 hypothetical protein I545_1291 [Mycobacterium kansasii 662]OOK82674.1 hypothetical protein BZL30_0237 [Mycobacterium kansasii]OOK83475.1 hypothetical protein BZL29_1573 [Mycobacterium kansasii]